ncbi:ASCH domain-containing protein [Nocardioides panacisoli]|uniref:ASCH domain-containing protein n=1 Tax=Nocardioides panacisoli TaxID=627624 RepID=A0ABP7J176_9ACTN
MTDPVDPDDEAINDFWNEAKRRIHLEEVSVYVGPSPLAAVPPPAWSFGSAEQGDALLALVLDGTKTATASALRDYESEDSPLPEPGSMGIVLDGSGNPRALVATTDVRVARFDEVDAEHARLEGEGDRSLDHWREVHERFFAEHAPGGFSPDMKVVLERFKVVYPPSSRPHAQGR